MRTAQRDPEETVRLLDRYRAAEAVVCGIRVLVHEQTDPWWLLRDDVVEGLAARPAIEHALDVFRPARLMNGGDWPISLMHGGYHATWPLTTELLRGLSGPERADVLGGTATRCYGLGGPRR
jgi:hypothetical protein